MRDEHKKKYEEELIHICAMSDIQSKIFITGTSSTYWLSIIGFDYPLIHGYLRRLDLVNKESKSENT